MIPAQPTRPPSAGETYEALEGRPAGTVVEMGELLRYALVERERRFLISRIPDGVAETRRVTDRYLEGTRLRLREVVAVDGSVTRKLGQKVRLSEGPAEIACTSIYLDDAEWALLRALPARTLTKTRHLVHRDGLQLIVDEFADGTLLAEIDERDRGPRPVPAWLDVIREVTDDEAWTGHRLAA